MKTYSNEMPLTLLPLKDGNYHYNYNITTEEVTDELVEDEPTTRTQYVYDTVFIPKEPKPTVTNVTKLILAEMETKDKAAAKEHARIVVDEYKKLNR